MTRQLQMKYSHILTGEFSIKDLNLMLVFQVNCPGCFLHAFPMAFELHERYHKLGLNFFALSTAFEDFQYNNLANTQKFIEQGQLIGVTKNTFERNGLIFPKRPIKFPVLFDQLGSGTELFNQDDVDYIFRTHFAPRQPNLNQKDQAIQRITDYVSNLPKASYTFHLNQLPGTPTWVLFDSHYRILEQHFGHMSYDALSAQLDERLSISQAS